MFVDVETQTTQRTTVQGTQGSIKRTTLNIEEGLYAQSRIAAINLKISTMRAIEVALRFWLDAGCPMPAEDSEHANTAA